MSATIVVVRSAVVAAEALDVLCPDENDRRGELTTDRSESSCGLPVGGVAYGPADLGEHELVVFTAHDEDRLAARRAGYTLATMTEAEESAE